VKYWIPYDGVYGFHDSSWQTFPYGSQQYRTDGSHGCVHFPLTVMSWIYQLGAGRGHRHHPDLTLPQRGLAQPRSF